MNYNYYFGLGIDIGTAVLYFSEDKDRLDKVLDGNPTKNIWVVTNAYYNDTDVEVSNGSRNFYCPIDYLITIPNATKLGILDKITIPQKYLDAHKDIIKDSKNLYTNFVVSSYTNKKDYDTAIIDNPITNTTTKASNMKNNIVDANASATKVAAKITAGKTLNKVIMAKVKPQLPMMARGYADHVLSEVVLANLVSFAVTNFATANPKAVYIADAMMQAAMVEFMGSFNLEKLLSDALDASGIEVPVAE